MPKPDAVNGDNPSYQLTFTAQSSTDASELHRTFTWSVTGGGGFTIEPAYTEGDTRSVAIGTITSDVSAGTVYTVNVHATSPMWSGDFKQTFIFHAGTLTPKKEYVFAGGLDDAAHKTNLDFSGGSLTLDTMKIETDANYGHNKMKPSVVAKTSTSWEFTSSNKVPGTYGSSKAFTIGAYVKIPLKSSETVRVAHASVSQTAGIFSDTTKGNRSKIYGNGAVNFDVTYSALHTINATLSGSNAKEFLLKGSTDGTGSLTFSVWKTVPKDKDPVTTVPHGFEVLFTDKQVYDESDQPITQTLGRRVEGAEKSFWGGAYWNWASAGLRGSGYKEGEQDTNPAGKFGHSGTWHEKNEKTDDMVEQLNALSLQLAQANADIENIQNTWNVAKAAYQESLKDYNEYVAARNLVEEIGASITTMPEEIKSETSALWLAEREKEILVAKLTVLMIKIIAQSAPTAEDTQELTSLNEKIADVNNRIANLMITIDILEKKYQHWALGLTDKLAKLSAFLSLRNILGSADLIYNGLPNLLKAGETANRELESLNKIITLTNFCTALMNKIQNNKNVSVDPDEKEKRRLLVVPLADLFEKNEAVYINTLKAIARLKANRDLLEDLKIKIDLLKEADTTLAIFRALKERFTSLLAGPLKALLGKKLYDALDWLGVNGDLLDLLGDSSILKLFFDDAIQSANTIVDQTDKGLFQSLDALQGGSALATQAILPYRIWITPTVEFPESRLQALTPKWGDK
jgi:hypothetical protein